MYPGDDVPREQKYTEQNQTEHCQVQHDEHVVHVVRGGQRNTATTARAETRVGGRGGEGGLCPRATVERRFRDARPDGRRGEGLRGVKETDDVSAVGFKGYVDALKTPLRTELHTNPTPSPRRNGRGEAERSGVT